MQGEVISEKILEDARIKAKEIINNAKKKQLEIEKTLTLYQENLLSIVNDKVKVKKEEIIKHYKTKLNIEKNRSELACKQEIIKKLCNDAKESFFKLSKKEKLNFIDLLVKKEATKNDVLFLLIKGVNSKDVESLKSVKDKNLLVKKGDKEGIVFSNKIFDNSFLLDELIMNCYRKNEQTIINLLFV